MMIDQRDIVPESAWHAPVIEEFSIATATLAGGDGDTTPGGFSDGDGTLS